MAVIEFAGFVAVSAMVAFYALESRGSIFVLGFSISCLASAAYAAAIGSWPFATVETLWAFVALRRFSRMRRGEIER